MAWTNVAKPTTPTNWTKVSHGGEVAYDKEIDYDDSNTAYS